MCDVIYEIMYYMRDIINYIFNLMHVYFK
jgi:hypothetical protein